jgi:hypothetical protein
MGNDGKQPGLSSTGILWLVLLGAGALFLREVPWQGSRPAGVELKRYTKAAYQDVDARLWQDPMGAVAQAREGNKREGERFQVESSAGAAGRCAPRSQSRRRRCFVQATTTVTTRTRTCSSSAMVSGAPIRADRVPARARYAILAGLIETGFVPEDEEHLGYIFPITPREASIRRKSPCRFIAYEWLVPVEADTCPGTPLEHSVVSDAGSVLMLWLDEDSFGDSERQDRRSQPSACARAMSGSPPKKGAELAVRRPRTLGDVALQAMLAKAMAQGDERRQRKRRKARRRGRQKIPLVFYAFGATAADAGLLAEAGVEAK